MRYGSVCSGIEAATMAWHPLGWTPAFFSEIEAFPSAVLAHHYGSNMPDEPDATNGVPNHGDMTKFEEWPDHAIDLLVGGTPCQSFSVAGLRGGLDDARGNLMLTYGAIARRYRPRWLVWENVPGVLSSDGGRDFASLLGLLSGRRVEVPATGWRNAGIVEGYKGAYGLAWRVLDAQYVRVDGFGRAVPQRRRRVFVVGYLGDWRRAAAVLLERQGLCGDSAPSRASGKNVAPTVSARPSGGGGLGTDFDLDGGLIAKPLLAGGHANNPLDDGADTSPLASKGVTVSEESVRSIAAYVEQLERELAEARRQPEGLSKWYGWDQSNLPWSHCHHQDAVCAALFGPTWSMEDAHALISFIDRTWGAKAQPHSETRQEQSNG